MSRHHYYEELIKRQEDVPSNLSKDVQGDMYVKLSVHKKPGLGAYTIASTHFKSKGNGYNVESFIMHRDFNKIVQESIVRTGRVSDKTLGQSLELAKQHLPAIHQAIKAHYQWTD
jgi:hypothetical protein